jgi:hypothetical protein
MSNQTNYTFEVTEVIVNKDSAEVVANSSDTLNDQYLKPYNHLYINTKAVDYEREYVTPEHLEEALEDERAITDSELDSLQNQVDFMAQEINHLIPIKEEGTWQVGATYTTRGYVKFNSTARYGPWDEGKPIDQIYFNHYGSDLDANGDMVNHKDLLQNMQIGDKFECFVSKNNYCLFEVTRISDNSNYTILYVTPLKYEGEGYQRDDLATFEFFEANDVKPANLDGWYNYSLAKIEDQITKDNIHEHPGRFICVNGDGEVVDNQYSGTIKFVYFAPIDAHGDRMVVAENARDAFKLKVWEIRTRAKSRSTGNITPSFLYTPKTDSKPFLVGNHYNQAAQIIPAIKINADENWVTSYDDMGSSGYPQYWRWPI